MTDLESCANYADAWEPGSRLWASQDSSSMPKRMLVTLHSDEMLVPTDIVILDPASLTPMVCFGHRKIYKIEVK